MWFLNVVSFVLVLLSSSRAQTDDFFYGQFPDDFLFGTASAAFQIEGAWNLDGKGEGFWDHYNHLDPSPVADGSNANIACDSYHLYKEDVQLLEDVGVHFYRFSISWARLLPAGTADVVNPAGIAYYNNLINALVNAKIIPMVTLYHGDMPQALQEKYGGWMNETIIDDFGNYVRICFSYFGDRVKHWITLNEPYEGGHWGYGMGTSAPGVYSPGLGEYVVNENFLKAHARAWHIYNNEFRQEQRGMIGITLDSSWYEPKTNSTEDIAAADRAIQFQLGWFAHPIFSLAGDYPAVVREEIDRKSQLEGYSHSRLPQLGEEWVSYIRGTHDFLGLNHYSTSYAEPGRGVIIPSFDNDRGVTLSDDPSWEGSTAGWSKTVPWGLRKIVNWLKNEYNNPIVFITENGYGDAGEKNDTARIKYVQGYLNELMKAVVLDGCNVRGYALWSIMDNFEWTSGYTIKFGINSVDFDDPTRPRSPKDSVEAYATIIRNNGFPNPE